MPKIGCSLRANSYEKQVTQWLTLAFRWRSRILDQSEVVERSEAKARITISELLSLAANSNTGAIVDVCRQLASNTEEVPAPAYGGSLRYWFKGKMIFGVNVAGARRRPPASELDVWIPVPKVAEVTSVPEGVIRETLKRDFAATESGTTDCIIRLKSPEAAMKLVSLVRQWILSLTPRDKTAIQ